MLKRRPLQAMRALGRLVDDPRDTAQVFVIMRALAGDAIARGQTRFAATPTGAAVLASRRDLLASLTDRGALAGLPEGSLGRAYLDLVQRAGITAEGLVAASEEAATDYATLTPDQALYARRLRDSHDLWHVVTGYGTDPFGEVCVVAFSHPQTGNLGFAAIAVIGALKTARETGNLGVFAAVWRAWRDGRRAAWFPGQDWEARLAQPLAVVRKELRVDVRTREMPREAQPFERATA